MARTIYSDFFQTTIQQEFEDFLLEHHPNLYEIYLFFLLYNDYSFLPEEAKVCFFLALFLTSVQKSRAEYLPQGNTGRVGNLRPLDVRKVREAVDAVRNNLSVANELFDSVRIVIAPHINLFSAQHRPHLAFNLRTMDSLL